MRNRNIASHEQDLLYYLLHLSKVFQRWGPALGLTSKIYLKPSTFVPHTEHKRDPQSRRGGSIGRLRKAQSIPKFSSAFSPPVVRSGATYNTTEATRVPFCTKGFHNHICYWSLAFLTLRRIPVGMTVHTPSIPILLYKRRRRIEGITALRAEEMAHVPLCAACHDNFTFYRRLAALTSWAEQLMEVQMTEKPRAFIMTVFRFQAQHIFICWMRRNARNIFTGESSTDARYAFSVLVLWLGVESYAFKVFTAVMAHEAFRMEAGACCRDDAA